MKNDDFLNLFQNLSINSKEKSLLEYLNVIMKRKWILILSLFFFISAALMFNYLVPETYSSSVLMKKENVDNTYRQDEFKQIIESKNTDKIETEMKLVKTSEVLNKVIDELKLNLVFDKIVIPNEKELIIDDYYLNYINEYLVANPNGMSYPRFVEFKSISNSTNSYKIKKLSDDTYELYDIEKNKLISRSPQENSFVINTSSSEFIIDWTNAVPNSELYFTVLNGRAAIKMLESMIDLQQEDETNIFRITVESTNPKSAQMIANTIADKFKETRIDQEKMAIRYSYKFIDDQIDEISENLKKSEEELLDYKSKNRLLSMNENSSQIVDLLSQLEVEKVNVDLELNQYQDKLGAIENEYKDKGYFDQTYLTPERSSEAYTPFSSLMLKLADLEVQRIETLNRKLESHPEVVKIDEQIAEIKNRLSSFNQNTITAYQIIINTLKAKQNNLEGLVSKYNSQLSSLPAKENKYAELLREKSVYEKVYTLLIDKREELKLAELSKLQDIAVVEPAQIPLTAVFPNKQFNLSIGIFAGFVCGIFLIVAVELNNKKKLHLDDLENEYLIPIFSIIPNYSKELKKRIYNSKKIEDRFVVMMNTAEGYKETYRILRTKIYNSKNKIKTLMFTSCEENSGKTTVVANLALLLVQSDKKVLMIDCDLKRGRLTNMFNVSKNSPGIITAAKEQKINPMIYSLIKPSKNNGAAKYDLHLIPPGGILDNSSEILESEIFAKIIKNIETLQYDYILIDTPPVNRVVDPLIIAKYVKDAILIVRDDYTMKDSFKWGVHELKQTGIKIHGIVINACDIDNSPFKYKYGYAGSYSCNYTDENSVPSNGNGLKQNKPITTAEA